MLRVQMDELVGKNEKSLGGVKDKPSAVSVIFNRTVAYDK